MHRFIVGLLGALSLGLLYSAKPLRSWLIAWQDERFIGMTNLFPVLRRYRWTAGTFAQKLLTVIIYGLALGALVAAIFVAQDHSFGRDQ
jgi:hypothetical protein